MVSAGLDVVRSRLAVLVVCGGLVAGCLSPDRFNPGEVGPRAPSVAPASEQDIRAAIERGVRFLVYSQNKNGSWGTVRHKGRNIMMPAPTGFQAMRAAVTSLAVMALVEADSKQPGAAEALRRGEDWLIANLPQTRVSSLAAMYNNWTHAYGIQAMVRMLHRRPMDEKRELAIRRVIRDQLARLERNQHLDGGWGYYSFTAKAPGLILSADSNCFMTATVLIAMDEARGAGFAVPDRVVDAAVESIRHQRRPDFAYAYSYEAARAPMWGINQPPGSLARSQVCNAATRVWGDKAVTMAVIRTWLDRFLARNDWLSMARKLPIPHEGHYQVAAYFYYYGHYYAALCIGLLPPAERPRFQNGMAHILLPLQEKDGSWWDFPFYGYHQQYGTAFAVMALRRCLASPADQAAGSAAAVVR